MPKSTIARIGLLGLAIGLSTLWPATSASAQEGGEGLDGQELFVAQKCNMCHAVPLANVEAKTKSEKMKGPDLGGQVEIDFEKLAAFLRQESVPEGKTKHKKGFKGADEELQAILDWLGSLEAEE